MEPKTEEDEFAAERERIEERHRVEVLNLLRSFEFERKDTEARLRAEMENKENESLKPGQSGILDTGAFLHEIDDLDNKLDRENGEDKELRKRFEQEKEDFLRRIRQLEEEVVSKRQIDYAGVDKKDFEFDGVVAEDVGSASEVEGEEVSSEKHETNTPISTKNTVGNQEPPTEDNAPISSNGLVKSLTELEEENNELKEELDHQRDQVHKLQNQVQVLNRKLDNVRQVLGDQEAFAADKQEKIREIIENDLTESAGGKTETKDGHALGDGTTGSPDFQGNRSSSVMSFQIEELNVENEELKSNVHKLEQKIQRTIEEYEIQRSVFKEKLDLILQSLSESQLPDQDSRGSENAKNIAEDIVDQMKNLMLKGTSEELLEEYVNIILGHQSASKSPDVFDINLHHEIQSLEHLLDIEIFDGRVFDDEMKDEVRQVLRDKERELIVAYAVEKLRVEIRHRLTTQSTLEELRKEREKEFMVYHKTNEFLKEHLGIASSAESGTKDVKDALMKDFKEESKSQGGRNEDGINPADVETLKAEKEELESALQELQDHFQKERQDWLSKLESPLHDDSDQDEKEKAVHRLRAQMVIMEQVLNTERFNLGRLYYSEMKEELEASLKQHQFERSGKYEKERVTQAWRHHAEVSELYRKILDKETEDMASLKEKLRGGSEPEKDNLQCDDSSQDQLKKESSRLDNLVPLKLELVELQQKRCREHSTATLILEQAVNAVETAVQENDNLLVSGDFFQRKSSWASSEEERDNLDPREQDPMVSQYSGEAETNREAASPPKETINSKEALKKALRKILEKLLNEKTADTDPEPDSYTSESDFSELELDGSTKKDGEREDENVVEKVHSQAEPEESHSEARAEVDGNVEDVPDDNQVTPDTKSSVPVIVTLSPRTQNVFEIERFNISRLLRDEYIDRIRSQRRKVRRIKARNNGNNGKLLEQFQEQCDLLLERVNFGESVGRRDEVLPKRQRLTSTPSDDSGIADFADADKDGVVRKYKELLEKARKDLNHAHRALRERPEKINENEINNELREMNRRLKERENDLNEVEVKHAGLENERKELLDRIKSAGPSSNGTGNVGSESGVPEEEPGFHGSLLDQVAQPDDGTRFDVAVAQPVDGTGINVATAGGDLPVRRGSSNDLCSEIPEEKGLDAEANGVDSELDRRRLSKEHEELKLKVDTLEKEIEVKDQEFLELSRSKQEEVNELQRKFIEGTGSEEILDELQKKLSEAIEGKRELEARCSEMEKPIGSGRSNEANGEEKDVMKELERLKNENNVLENKNNEKQEKIEELQLKMLGGSDGEEILKDLQNELRELNEKNKSLEMENRKLMGDDISERAKDQLDNSKAGTIAELKHDNSTLELENQEMSKQLEKLQNDLLKGTGSEDVLEELQKKVKDLNAKNKELEKVCRNCEENEASGDLENTDVKRLEKELEKLGDEKQKLAVDNKNKDDEIGELQRKLVEGSGGEEVLANLQQQMKELKHTNENLEVRCQEMEDLNSELKIDKEENDIEFEFEKEISKLKEENAGLVEKNKSKDNEIRELQKSLVDGSGGEELLQRLQDKIQELEEKQKTLEKRCRELEESNERMEIKEKDLTNENKEMANEVIRTKKENDYLERESKAKTDEILRLQENLLDGTGGEEILKQLQDQVKEKEEMNKELRKKCNEIEAHEQALIEDKEEDEKGTEKELVKLRDENQRLIRDNRDINNEISDLQKKLVEGTGGEDILTNIQHQIKTLKEENKKLEGDCDHLKDENEKLKTDKDKKEKEAVQANRLAEENANLVGENKSKDNEIRELQRKLVDGSGGEEILQNLQDKVKELEGNNKILQDQCRDLDGVIENMAKKETELTNENREIANEVIRMKKENDYLERESKAKTDEILRLQENLLDGTGGEEILKQLQEQIKEKEGMNKDLMKKCNEIEAREEALKEIEEKGEKARDKELVKLQDENRRLVRDKRDKDNEISNLQKKLVDGTGGEDVLANIQDQMKTLREKNEKLEADCADLKDENERLGSNDDGTNEEKEEICRLRLKNASLVDENKSKDDEIHELQKALVKGSGAEEVLQALQDKINDETEKRIALEKHCGELTAANRKMAERENDYKDENDKMKEKLSGMKKENDFLEHESQAKSDEISKLQDTLLTGTGAEDILDELRDKIKELEEMNKDLRKRCNEMQVCEDKVKNERSKELSRLEDEVEKITFDNKNKEDEISGLQKKLVEGTGAEDVLEKLQAQLKNLKEKNDELEKDCCDLKERNRRSSDFDQKLQDNTDEISKLRDENERLVNENQAKDDEICDLQQKLVSGTDSEEIVQQLQGKAEMYAKRNKELEKKCKDMENVSESLRNRDYDRTGKGVDEIKKENGDLKRDNEGRTEEVDQLQQDSVKSCGSEDIVQQLQDDGKELKENGEKLNERKVDELKTEDEKLLDDYKLEVAELMKINEELEDDIQKKSQEINRMQKMLVEGTGSEEVLQDLQDQMKELEQRNKQLENTQNYLKNSEEMLKRDDGDGEGKVELDKLRNQMSRLEDDNSRQKDEIFELQQKLVSGTGAEKVLEELQEQLKDSEDKNRNLRTYCDDLQEDNDRLKKDKVKIKDDIRGRPIAYHSENEKELERLRKDVSELKLAKEDKEEEVSRLQRKLLEGTGAEDLLQELQERLKDSEEKIKDLEIECSNLEEARNNLREENKELQEARGKMRSVAVPSRKKKSLEEREMDKKGSKVPPGIFDSLVDNEEEDPGSRKAEAEVSGEFRQKENVIEGGSELEDKDDVSQVRSHDDCLEMIPKIVEERDHWKGKYKALRKKVGESFVDIIPEVCSEETMLEKERDKTLSKLSDVRKEINEEETPLLKTMSENERIQKELREVEDHLEDTNEQLEHIKDLREQERRIKEEQSMLRQCLAGLESSNDDLNDQEQGFVVEHGNKESESGKNETRGKVKKLCEEMDNLLAEEARGSSEKKQGHHHLGVLFDDKIKTKRELRNLEQAIEDLRQSSSGEFSMGERLGSVDRDQLEADLGDNTAIQGELEDIRKEVDELQSSLETSNVATGNELGILVALMKEKSRLDDELSVVDKTLGQLSKRDRENLLKERAKQEKVAKRLLELSREKEVAQSELKEIEALVQTKELELLAYFELESNKEKPPVNYSVKRKVSREGAGGAEENIEDPAGGISSADESIGESLEEEKPLSSEDAVVLSEELGLMIQKKSSLGVRLESLGKEITTQSLKVEKSLLGVKEDPTGGTSPRSSHSSLDDLSQSQLSIFDNLDLIDELSVATGIVRDERIKRKTSRKAPMAKLLKEKAGLEKKVKESDGKILVQNAKIRNALREGKDPGRAQAKFAQALEEREKVEDDLASVLNKIDECKLQSDEFAGKGKLGKRRASTGSMGRLGKPGGKSLSKNDKRRLLSQKKSLEKELDGVKRQIDDYSLEGGDDGLQDFPEMVEVGNVGRTVERLRKLINREALLKQNLEGVASSDEQLGRADGEKVKGNAALYPGVMNVLQAEKEKKEAKLAELEKDIKHERKFTDAAKNKNDLKKRKRALKNDMEITLKELEDEEETLMVELEDLATKRDRTASEKEEILKEEVIALSKQKEKLEKQLGNLQDILQRQVAESDQKREQISEKYQQFAELKNEEEDLGKTLEDINKKLLTRKEWAADSDGQRTSLETQHDNDENNEAESYGEILKRMDEEDLNMADLIRELEATQETLSKEREITGELLDLIKSRVGNELLEALTGDGLPSPSRETAEMSSAGDYQDVASKIEHDSVTVAEIIAEYKKMNEVSVKENQKLANMLDVLKRKVDEDLFTSIVSEEPADCEASKKFELSKILENNQTLFQQIVAKSEPERRMKTNLAEVLEDESKEVKDELNNGENQSKENERIKDKLGNLKREVESITTDLNEVKKEELEEELGDVEELKKENACSKELIQDLKNELESVSSELDEVKKTKEELEMDRNDAKEFKEEISRSKEKIQDLENESESRTRKLDEVEKTKKELEEKIDDVEELKEENARLKRTIQDLKAELESITRELDEVKKTNEETEKGRDDVEELEKEDTCSNDMIQNLQKELESITSELEDANKMNDEMRNKLKSDHGIREENERLKEKLAAFEKEKRDEIFNEIKENNTNDGIESTLSTELERNEDDNSVKPNLDAVEKKNEEMISKFERDQKTRKETKSADETSDGLKCLEELKEENPAMKEMLEVLEKENNEIIPTLEDLKKTKKELEDEVEYLREENEDLLSVNGKLRENEHKKETMIEELERLENEKKEIVDYVENDLQQDATTGVKKALEDYNKQFKDMEKQCDQMRSECESLKELREVIGKKLAEKLLGLSKERRGDLEDTLYNPRCIERILTHQITLAKILEKNEKDLDTMEERLGQELFSCISDQDLGLKEERGERSLKISDQVKDGGKDLTQIVKSYEDLIESQADEINMAETLSQKVEAMEKELETLRNQKGQSEEQFDEFCKEGSVELGSIEVDQDKMETFQENLDSSESATPGKSKKWKEDEKPGVIVGDDEDFPENLEDDAGPTASLHEEMNGEQKVPFDPNEKGMLLEQHGSEPPDMELEYQELLKKMIEHQKEIEEAEEMLREQKTQHELEKKELLGHFNNEKNNMQHHIECERKSMEKAMQNLINEIVRLKEERKEIRKINRIEKEKMEAAFEKERAELYSNNETVKAEIQEKLGKAFSHVSQKEKLMMEQREQELQEELVHLRNERKEMAVKLKEMERKLEDQSSLYKESNLSRDLTQKNAREEIRNEFEDKMRQEKKTFQETLLSLRKEIDRLQQERYEALNKASEEKAAKVHDEETAESSAYRLSVYERLESDFKAKVQSEKASFENRIRELRGEKEELERQKQEIKTAMRKQRLEMTKKHEKEKDELAEKHRNEMKALRNKHRERVKDEQTDNETHSIARSFSDSRNLYELQRTVREKDAKIRRYETFFRELNQEASIFQQDPDIAV